MGDDIFRVLTGKGGGDVIGFPWGKVLVLAGIIFLVLMVVYFIIVLSGMWRR